MHFGKVKGGNSSAFSPAAPFVEVDGAKVSHERNNLSLCMSGIELDYESWHDFNWQDINSTANTAMKDLGAPQALHSHPPSIDSASSAERQRDGAGFIGRDLLFNGVLTDNGATGNLLT